MTKATRLKVVRVLGMIVIAAMAYKMAFVDNAPNWAISMLFLIAFVNLYPTDSDKVNQP